MPSIISCIIVANLALCGFPFLAGFYSKDIIIEQTISTPFNLCIFIITIIRLGLTAFYSIRATVVGIVSPKLTLPFSTISEPNQIIKPIILLSRRAIIIGSIIS
jgi:NADH-ubiquinone oxidoreductase chain 5